MASPPRAAALNNVVDAAQIPPASALPSTLWPPTIAPPSRYPVRKLTSPRARQKSKVSPGRTTTPFRRRAGTVMFAENPLCALTW